MLHTIKYSMRTVIRNWSACFWLILFPMILGTLFKIALSNLGVPLERIPVAVVTAENAGKQEIETFRRAADNLGEEDLLEIRYCEKEEALELLEKEEVEGILTVGKRISLSISGKSYNDRKNMNRNILNTFVNRYNHLEDVVSGMREEHFYNREESLSATKGDNYVAYFYNLLAMTCMFCSMSGLEISLNNQGNLTALGARHNISPMPKQHSDRLCLYKSGAAGGSYQPPAAYSAHPVCFGYDRFRFWFFSGSHRAHVGENEKCDSCRCVSDLLLFKRSDGGNDEGIY